MAWQTEPVMKITGFLLGAAFWENETGDVAGESGFGGQMKNERSKPERGCKISLATPRNTGAAGRNRTHDPLVRSQVLYPAELQPRKTKLYISFVNFGRGKYLKNLIFLLAYRGKTLFLLALNQVRYYATDIAHWEALFLISFYFFARYFNLSYFSRRVAADFIG